MKIKVSPLQKIQAQASLNYLEETGQIQFSIKTTGRRCVQHMKALCFSEKPVMLSRHGVRFYLIDIWSQLIDIYEFCL